MIDALVVDHSVGIVHPFFFWGKMKLGAVRFFVVIRLNHSGGLCFFMFFVLTGKEYNDTGDRP